MSAQPLCASISVVLARLSHACCIREVCQKLRSVRMKSTEALCVKGDSMVAQMCVYNGRSDKSWV